MLDLNLSSPSNDISHNMAGRPRSSESEGTPHPPKRLRDSRPCAECRRLKIKCDQQVPCSGCVKRGRAELCPNKAFSSAREQFEQNKELSERVRRLEAALASPSQQLQFTSSPNDLNPSAAMSESEQTLPPIVSPILQPATSSPQGVYQSTTTISQYEDIPTVFRGAETFVDTGQSGHGGLSASMPVEQHQPPSAWLLPDPPVEGGGGSSLSDESSPLDSSGTLVINSDGRTRFIGPSASSQYHRESPNALERPNLHVGSMLGGFVPLTRPTPALYGQVALELPPEREARDLVERYYRLIAWTGTPILRADMLRIVGTTYKHAPNVPPGQDLRLALHQLSLLYVVMALGQLANMEVPPNDPESKHFFALSQQCLFSGSFLVYNTLSCVQSLSLLAKFAAYSDLPGGWEVGWQIRGIASRIMTAMGLHRDGAKWGLTNKELHDRRRVFWEAHSSEIFMVSPYGICCPIHSSQDEADRMRTVKKLGSPVSEDSTAGAE
ncbi:hypothetical protein IAT40_002230 [Kwoniella sp. CBS 6097]